MKSQQVGARFLFWDWYYIAHIHNLLILLCVSYSFTLRVFTFKKCNLASKKCTKHKMLKITSNNNRIKSPWAIKQVINRKHISGSILTIMLQLPGRITHQAPLTAILHTNFTVSTPDSRLSVGITNIYQTRWQPVFLHSFQLSCHPSWFSVSSNIIHWRCHSHRKWGSVHTGLCVCLHMCIHCS